MQQGGDNVQINLAKPIPVYGTPIPVYGTAVAKEDGSIHFFEDLYGHDADLEKVLAKGYPFPR